MSEFLIPAYESNVPAQTQLTIDQVIKDRDREQRRVLHPDAEANQELINKIESHALLVQQACNIHINQEGLIIQLIDQKEYKEKGTNHDLSMTPQIMAVKNFNKAIHQAEQALAHLEEYDMHLCSMTPDQYRAESVNFENRDFI
jgi:hypothetical protein